MMRNDLGGVIAVTNQYRDVSQVENQVHRHGDVKRELLIATAVAHAARTLEGSGVVGVDHDQREQSAQAESEPKGSQLPPEQRERNSDDVLQRQCTENELDVDEEEEPQDPRRGVDAPLGDVAKGCYSSCCPATQEVLRFV